MKNRYIAAFFGFVFGVVSLNEFYLGNIGKAILKLVIMLVGPLIAWGISLDAEFGVIASSIIYLIITTINTIKSICYLWCDSDEEMMNKYSDLPVQINS